MASEPVATGIAAGLFGRYGESGKRFPTASGKSFAWLCYYALALARRASLPPKLFKCWGGPILKGRTFFYFSYEGLRLWQPGEGQIAVPSLNARQAATGAIQDLLNAFPRPNGPEDPASMLATFTGNFPGRTSSDNTSIRFDQVVGHRLLVFGRYSEAPSESDFSGLGTGRTVASFRSATLGATLVISPNATSDLRLNYSRNEAGGFSDPGFAFIGTSRISLSQSVSIGYRTIKLLYV